MSFGRTTAGGALAAKQLALSGVVFAFVDVDTDFTGVQEAGFWQCDRVCPAVFSVFCPSCYLAVDARGFGVYLCLAEVAGEEWGERHFFRVLVVGWVVKPRPFVVIRVWVRVGAG